MLRGFAGFALLALLSACGAGGGVYDEYGRPHETYAAAIAHMQMELDAVLAGIDPLATPLAEKATIILPSRENIRMAIMAAEPGAPDEFIEGNTDYVETDMSMFPRHVVKRNIFSKVEIVEGSGNEGVPKTNEYVIDYIFRTTGVHIHMSRGSSFASLASPAPDRVELPRQSWVEANDHLTATRGMLREIESFVRSGSR
jgi:hypothetical protein